MLAAREAFPLPYEVLKRTINRPAEELYDLNSDPFELHNLINDSRYALHQHELSAALDRWMKETGDPGVGLKNAARRTSP